MSSPKGPFAHNGSRQYAFAFFSTSALDHRDQVGMRVSFPRTMAHVSHVTDGHAPPSPSSILGLTSVSHLDENGGHTGGYGRDVMEADWTGTG